jgi:hypothetical protein
MPRLTFEAGLYTDGPDLSLPGKFVGGNNIRFRDGRPETIDLWRPISTPLTGKGRAIICAETRDVTSGGAVHRTTMILVGTHSHLYRGTKPGETWAFEDISEMSNFIENNGKEYSTYINGIKINPSHLWSFSQTLSGIFCTHPLGYYALMTGRNQTTGDDLFMHHCSFITEDNFAVYLGISANIVQRSNANDEIAATWTNKTVVWSDQDGYLDFTIDDTHLAGFKTLNDGNYAVGGAATTRGNLIWTDTSLYRMDPLYDAEFVFGFNKIDTGCGMAGPHAWAQADGRVFWISPQLGLHEFDGGSVREILCPIRSETFDTILFDQLWNVTASTDTSANEVVFNIPRGRNGDEIDGEFRYNYLNGSFSLGDKGRTAQTDRSPLSSGFSVGNDSIVYEEGLGPLDEDVEPLSWSVITAPIEIAMLTDKADAYDRALTLNRLRIDRRTTLPLNLEGDVTVSIIARSNPEPGDEQPRVERKILHPTTRFLDFHIEGQQLQIELSATSRARHRFGDIFGWFNQGGDRG